MSRVLARLRGRDPGPLRVGAPSDLLAALRDGAVPLAPGARASAEASQLRIAVMIPPFRRGSGGHGAIAHLIRGLEARGHQCEVRVLDDEGRHEPAQLAADFRAWFGPVQADVRLGLGGWDGADIAVATGWQTVPCILRLAGVKARAYLVQDHEPEFYPTSAEREWAAWTYRQGLHHVASSGWLAQLIRDRYDGAASAFSYGVDHELYRPLADVARRDDSVLFYARAVTGRRAVPLGLLALEELARRRPALDIALYGEARPIAVPFRARQLGVLSDAQLAIAYAEATVGVVLSLTNPSLVPLDMLACGLPVVDVASESMVAEFGLDGPATLAAPHPLALCDAIEAQLDNPAERLQRAARGLAAVRARTFTAATEQVELGLREALRSAPGPA